MRLSDITPLILTYNEAPNIGRCLAGLGWAQEIVVVDSFSTDETEEICRGHRQVRFIQRCFDTHAAQWNFALHETAVGSPWVLALDADYVVSEAAVKELEALAPSTRTAGYRVRFDYAINGRRLRAALYPPVVVLFRREGATYIQDGHTQKVVVSGEVGELRAHFIHDDRKPLARWFASQQSYAQLEADHLLGARPSSLNMPDRIRRMAWPAPVLVALYVAIVKGCVLEGWPGCLYILQRLVAETMLATEIVDRRLHDCSSSEATTSAWP